jgi:hypothetical protein
VSDPREITGLLADIDAVLERSRTVLDDAVSNRPLVRIRERHELIYAPEWDEGARLAQWRAIYEETEDLPPLIGAALAYDAWLSIQPLQIDHGLSRLIAAAILRERGKTRHHLFAMNIGMRNALYRLRQTDGIGRRVGGFLEAVETGARRGFEDLQKIVLARDVMIRRCEGRRKSSNLPKLVALFVKKPLVSIPMAAKALKVSPQAIEGMLRELGGALPRELTGRGRFRAWGIL